MDDIRVAVLGFGRWGPNHVRNFSEVDGSSVYAIVEPDSAKRVQAKAKCRNARILDSIDGLLHDDGFDAAIVATPTETHVELVSALLAAGKHVLCEKPLAARWPDAQRVAELAERLGLVLMIGNVFLFNPGIQYLKGLIESKELGAPCYASCVRTNLGPVRSDVNAALDLAAHDISILDYLLEESPEWVSATGCAYLQSGVEDVVFATLSYHTRFSAHIEVSWLNPRKVRQITFVGKERMAVWDDLDPQSPISIYDRGFETEVTPGDYGEFMRVSVRDGDIHMPKVAGYQPLLAEAKAFLSYIRNGSCDLCDAWSGVRQSQILDAICVSLSRCGEPVRPASRITRGTSEVGIRSHGI